MKLGNFIVVEGFDNLEPAKLIVAKKIIGVYAKKAAEQNAVEEFLVSKQGNSIRVSAKAGETRTEAVSDDANLFIALSRALSEAVKKAKA